MTWETNDYRTYPARFPRFIREAPLTYPEPLFLGAFPSKPQAQAEATYFRKYRYLIRHHPGLDFSLDNLLASYDYRTRIVYDPGLHVYTLLLTARPTFTNHLLELNPDLADILYPACQ